MNFLSHGLLVRKTGSIDVMVGSSLPDLIPLADRKLRLTPRRLDLLEEAGATDIVRGCRHHKRVDRTFHNSAPFHRCLKALEAAFPAVTLPLPRNLLAHMLVEIGIDAEVLRRYPEFCRGTYPDAFEDFDWPGFLALLERITEVPTTHLAAMIDRFDRGRWLQTYSRDPGILDRIDGMMMRIGRPTMPAETRDALEPVVALARQQGRELFDDLMPWELELTPLQD